MSSSEAESTTNGVKLKYKTKFSMLSLKEVHKLPKDEIYVYIEKLHEAFKKNEKKIKKYKDRWKKLLKQKSQREDGADDAAEPKDSTTPEPNEPNLEKKPAGSEDEETNATAAFSFVDEMRQTAQQAQNLKDFVYEPTSGLYYDQKSGYYYNAEYGLYYDGNTGCYYSYNYESQSYEFHSQVEVQPNRSTQKVENYENGGEPNADDDEIEFDSWGGVITDPQKLRDIKAEKLKIQEAKERKRTKKKQNKARTSSPTPPVSTKVKKRKHNRRHSSEESGSDSAAGSGSDREKSRKRRASRRSARRPRDVEDGELSSSSSVSSKHGASGADTDNDAERDVAEFAGGSRFQDIAKKYPPSLRIIVQETNLQELKVGSLSLITFKGGSLGREGSHDVIIPDVNVSKYHLRFDYNHKKSLYTCLDLGSRNGTILNGTRMATAKRESEVHDLVHGSMLQVAQTKLLCHVHEGNSTCGLCEPGLLIREKRDVVVASPSASVALTHKEQLKILQKKYGLENEKFVDGKQSAGSYNDRAATRRIQVGSSTENEKTQTASVNTEISSENKGFKMLSKLGWSKGESLGKTNASTGLLEPINVASNTGKKGLGCDESNASAAPLTIADKKKMETWRKTQARYQKADIFCDSDDDDTK